MTGRARLAAALVAVALGLATAGCWDRLEIENVAWVLVVGIDSAQEDGFVFTFRVAVPRMLPGGGQVGGGESGRSFTTSILARSGFEAIDLFNTYVDRRLNLQHLRAIVVSDEVARSGRIEAFVDALVRFREFRRTVLLLVARGEAAPIVEAPEPLLTLNVGTFMDLLAGERTFHGLIDEALFHRFVLAAESTAEAPVPPLIALGRRPGGLAAPEPGREPPNPSGVELRDESPRGTRVRAGEVQRSGGNALELLGTAVFSGFRMVGTLTGDETRALSMIRGTFRRSFLAVPDPMAPGRLVAVQLRMERGPRIRVRRDGGRVALEVHISLEAGVVSVESPVDYSEPENAARLGAAVAEHLRRQGEAVVRRAQREFRADVFRFGEVVRTTFWRTRDWEAFNWPQRFPEADVRLAVEVAIRRHGFQRDPPVRRTERGG